VVVVQLERVRGGAVDERRIGYAQRRPGVTPDRGIAFARRAGRI